MGAWRLGLRIPPKTGIWFSISGRTGGLVRRREGRGRLGFGGSPWRVVLFCVYTMYEDLVNDDDDGDDDDDDGG